MKVKKFVANTMPEAMNQIRKELGIDAIILHSREIQTGGFLGFFTNRAIEVTAAIDKAPAKLNSKSIIVENKQEINEQLTENNRSENIRVNEPIARNTVVSDKNFIPPILNQVANHFLAQEVEKDIVDKITVKLLEQWYRQEEIEAHPNQLQLVHEWTANVLKDMLLNQQSKELNSNQKIISLVGPTGVGKTTTLAKLAATASLQQKKRVAFITTDTYRIAAIEQLKTYAEIISVPIKVAYNTDDFKSALQEFADFDQVFVDTAGRNFLKRFYVDELKNIIDFNHEMNTYLVMSLTAKYSDMQAIYKQFSTLNIKHLIFTKKDETATYGNILNMIIKNKVGVAYLTTGQNVPDDIQPITTDDLINLFTEDLFHE